MSLILLVSNTGDLHCDYLVDACNRLNVDCFRLNTDKFRRHGLLNWRVDKGTATLRIGERECVASEVTLLIYRRPIPAFQSDIVAEPWIGRLLDSEWASIEAALSFNIGGRVLNGVPGSAAARNKMIQVQTACDVGLNVPETLVSTDLDSLKAFASTFRCVTKGITNAFHIDGDKLRSALTSFVEDGELDHYDPMGSPTLLQRAVQPSAMWRIVVIGAEVLGFRFHGPKLTSTADSRKIEEELTGCPSVVPDSVAKGLVSMCKALSIEFASTDFIEDHGGDLWFLDLNPEGQWVFLEESFGVRISDQIIKLGLSIYS